MSGLPGRYCPNHPKKSVNQSIIHPIFFTMSFKYTLVCLSLLFSSTTFLFSQTPIDFALSGNAMRKMVDVQVGITPVHICGLTPGNHYIVIANPAHEGQSTQFALHPGPSLKQMDSEFSIDPAKPKVIEFKAPGTCVDLFLEPLLPATALGDIPCFLSINWPGLSAGRSVAPEIQATDRDDEPVDDRRRCSQFAGYQYFDRRQLL
jgi:hypothetical protein